MALSLLHANGADGAYPDSYYAARAGEQGPHRPRLGGAVTADICVVGGGYSGLSAALHLAEAGHSVRLLEAHRIGWGASGRNGGQLGTGLRWEQPELEARFGLETARALWQVTEDAKALVRALIAKHEIACDLKPGIAYPVHRAADLEDTLHHADHMARVYGYSLERLTRADCQALIRTEAYHGGLFDPGAGHLDPLALAIGLGRAAEKAGARLHENEEVVDIRGDTVVTRSGTVTARHIILAANGYLPPSLGPRVAARVMPINNFILATAPFDTTRILARDIAVADSKFVVNYFRLADDRLIFGGGETYGYRFPRDIKGFVRRKMLDIFPQISGVGVDYGWGGTLAVTRTRLPHFARLGPGLWSISGYSGQGVGMANMAGRLVAGAIDGDARGFDLMARLPTPPFPGGRHLRHPVLVAAMLWYALRDRL